MRKRALVPLAQGFEEIEAVTAIDILRRGGVEVVAAGLAPGPCVGRSGIAITPDCTLDEALRSTPFDAVVLPGGQPGTRNLANDPRVAAVLADVAGRGGIVAAVCAAPTVIHAAGLLGPGPFTSHPSARADLPAEGYVEDRVAVSGRVITSRAAGTAMEFTFAVLAALAGEDVARAVNESVMAEI